MKDTFQRRTRSFGGCLTCRTRRIKCDERHPKCTTCTKAGLICEGYEAKLKFLFHHQSPCKGPEKGTSAAYKKDEVFSRQQLFNDNDRLATSIKLTSQVERIGVDNIIEQLESRTNGALLGPFGIFSLDSSRLLDVEAELPAINEAEASLNAFDEEISRPGFTPDYSLASPTFDITSLDIFSFLSSDHTTNVTACSAADLSSWPATASPGAISSAEAFLLPDFTFLDSPNGVLQPEAPLSVNPTTTLDQDCRSVIPSNAQFLLSHYKSQMGLLFSPIRVKKPIWGILHLPSAMATFSELSVFGKTSHAKTALFYGLLAVSAFNLNNIAANSHTTYWWATGDRLSRKARHELQEACILELDGPDRSKYKDILMAVLNMITIAVVNAQQEEARSYLLNAELFMVLRSTQKTHHSRKAKMLHQIYLFLRIIEESTYIYPEEWHPIISPSNHELFSSMRYPSLRTHALSQGRDIDDLCGGNLEHCLLGQPCCTHKFDQLPLFSQVYGIPESLFSLISKITALANEIAALGPRGVANPLPARLHEVSMALENETCAWKNDDGTTEDGASSDENALPETRTYMSSFISAIHTATIILFYRRVYNINPLLLQSQVETVIDHLIRTEAEKVNSAVVNTAIVWPGFIAAAEALSPALQQKCENWLRGCAVSGLRNFELAADVARKVWVEREQRNDPAFSWVDLVRERRLALVLT